MYEESKAAKCGANQINEGSASACADSSDEAAADAPPRREVLKALRPSEA
jgi:hypothetical protein